MASMSRNAAEKSAQLFSILGDPSRLLILQAISVRGGVHVQEISRKVGMSQSAVSHQLQFLVEAKVARASKAGRVVTYSLASSAIARKISRLLRFK